MPSARHARVVVVAAAGLLVLAGAPAAPAAMTMKVPRFTVPPHSDREICTFVRLPRKSKFRSGGFEIINVGVAPEFVSHHFLMYSYTGKDMAAFPPKGKVVDSKACLDFGPADRNSRTLIGGSQRPRSLQTLPRGLAQEIDPPAAGEPIGIILNSHWINSSDRAQTAAVKVRLLPAKHGIKRLMKPIFDVVANAFIDVVPNSKSTAGAGWRVGGTDFGSGNGGSPVPKGAVCVATLTTHMHKRGELFSVELVQNHQKTLLFASSEYSDPPVNVYDGKNGRRPPILLQKGDGFDYSCTHGNGVDGKPLKLGCQETDADAPGKPIFPYGFHAAKQCTMPGDDPTECPAVDNEKYPGRAFTGKCVPANVVFGFTSDDEMCILPGSYYDANLSAPAGHECDLAMMPLLK